jgi:hypothetical protein
MSATLVMAFSARPRTIATVTVNAAPDPCRAWTKQTVLIEFPLQRIPR